MYMLYIWNYSTVTYGSLLKVMTRVGNELNMDLIDLCWKLSQGDSRSVWSTGCNKVIWHPEILSMTRVNMGRRKCTNQDKSVCYDQQVILRIKHYDYNLLVKSWPCRHHYVILNHLHTSLLNDLRVSWKWTPDLLLLFLHPSKAT